MLKFYDPDIGANLTDESYQGTYYGKECHPPDVDVVIERAWNSGVACFEIWISGDDEIMFGANNLLFNHMLGICLWRYRMCVVKKGESHLCFAGLDKIIVTAGEAEMSKSALQLAMTNGGLLVLFATQNMLFRMSWAAESSLSYASGY